VIPACKKFIELRWSRKSGYEKNKIGSFIVYRDMDMKNPGSAAMSPMAMSSSYIVSLVFIAKLIIRFSVRIPVLESE